jgi:pilus assembly protein Flp/PilA
MTAHLRDFVLGEDGVSLAEYGIITALIGLVCIVALSAIGTSVNTYFTNVVNALMTFEIGTPP